MFTLDLPINPHGQALHAVPNKTPANGRRYSGQWVAICTNCGHAYTFTSNKAGTIRCPSCQHGGIGAAIK